MAGIAPGGAVLSGAGILTIALAILAVASLAYGAAMGAMYSAGGFWLVWIAIGVALGATAWARHTGTWSQLPLWGRRGIAGAAVMLLASVIALFSLIASQAVARPPANLDYVIVLGADLTPSGKPKEALRYRLDAALDYLKRNPKTRCIVSGGQGDDEVRSEASAMREYLVAHGLASGRVIVEDRSTSTAENLRFSARLMSSPSASTAVVTNDFHVFRAIRIARKQGLANVRGFAAASNPLYLPQAALRECAAIVKDALAGNL